MQFKFTQVVFNIFSHTWGLYPGTWVFWKTSFVKSTKETLLSQLFILLWLIQPCHGPIVRNWSRFIVFLVQLPAIDLELLAQLLEPIA